MSPLEKRRAQALRETKESPEVQLLKKQVDELNAQINVIIRPLRESLQQVPRKVRTDFIPVETECYISWEVKAVLPDDELTHPMVSTIIFRGTDGRVYVSTPELCIPVNKGIPQAVETVAQELRAGGWVFVGAGMRGYRVQVTDWRELA